MRIAALQMVSTTRVADNVAAARRLIGTAAAAGARFAVLPEHFGLIGAHERDKLGIAETPLAGPLQAMLASAAREHRMWIVGGTVPMRIAGDDDHVHNTCCAFAPSGALAARYDKIHLFRFDDGREEYDERRVLRPGLHPVAFDAAGVRVGLSICYDLRFPELYRALMDPPCDLICVPAAFTYPTGQAHWELLLRARAVENQCYVLASAQGGHHETGRRTWGHSMVVDPWGEVLAMRAEGEGIVLAELDPERIKAVRAQLPSLAHRQLQR